MTAEAGQTELADWINNLNKVAALEPSVVVVDSQYSGPLLVRAFQLGGNGKSTVTLADFPSPGNIKTEHGVALNFYRPTSSQRVRRAHGPNLERMARIHGLVRTKIQGSRSVRSLG